MAISKDRAKFIASQIETLGDISVLFWELKAHGMTKGAIEYVTQQVWWEDEVTTNAEGQTRTSRVVLPGSIAHALGQRPTEKPKCAKCDREAAVTIQDGDNEWYSCNVHATWAPIQPDRVTERLVWNEWMADEGDVL